MPSEKKGNGRAQTWHLGHKIRSMDAFGVTMPQFNANGKTKFSTIYGGIASFIIFMAALAYAASNAPELVSPRSPVINYDKTSRWFGNDETEALKLSDSNFELAFTLQNYLTGETLDDPRYIQWQAARYYQDDQSFFQETLKFHKCTTEDYSQFNPVAEDQAEEIAKLKEKGLFCLDDLPEDFAVGGSYQSKFTNEVALFFNPCHMRPAAFFTDGVDEISEECIQDLEKQKEYLGFPILTWYYNSDRFQQYQFGQESITRESRFSSSFIDSGRPSWIKSEITVSKLNDDSGIFQLNGGTEKIMHGQESDFILNPSTWNKNPTQEEPDNRYIFTSLYFGQGKDLMAIKRKTEALITRELDLVKVVTQLRMLAVATLGTLTPQRLILAHKLPEIDVNDSKNDSSVDLEGTVACHRNVVSAIRHLSKSKDHTDRRFLDLARIKTASQKAAATTIMQECDSLSLQRNDDNGRNANHGISVDSSLADQTHNISQVVPITEEVRNRNDEDDIIQFKPRLNKKMRAVDSKQKVRND